MNEGIELACYGIKRAREELAALRQLPLDDRAIVLESAVIVLATAVEELTAVAALQDERIARLEVRDNKRGW